MTRKKQIHRGEVLKQAIAESGLTIKYIVAKAGYKTRASFYAHINNPDLPFSILEKYARALKHDFSEDFPEMHPQKLEDPLPNYTTLKPKTIEEAVEQRNLWKEKYYELLEKHLKLIEQQGLIR